MKTMKRILIVDDDHEFLIGMKMQLKNLYSLLTANSISSAIEILREHDVDLVLLDVNLGDENGLAGIKKIHNVHPLVGIAMLSGARDVETVVQAIRAGAVDYLNKPVETERITEVIEKAVATRSMQEKCEALISSVKQPKTGLEIIHKSKPMRDLIKQANQVKGHEANVLIVGETGTGKELLARHVHRIENKSRRPFIAVNCAAIPEHLLETELFGHESGAFTGASRRRIGKFELADGGDIFLDEISTMQLDLQVKLLRVLQEKEFSRLGSNSPIKANFRVISACNQPLDDMVEKGDFRMDLYHRLRVIQLNLPPLKERGDDVELLSEYFLEKFSKPNDRKHLSEGALKKLKNYSWPGNVRELSNVVQSMIIMNKSNEIDESSFPDWVMGGVRKSKQIKNHPEVNESAPSLGKCIDEKCSLREFVQKAEKSFIKKVIETNGGDKSKAAQSLGIGRTTLYSKMKELGMMK